MNSIFEDIPEPAPLCSDPYPPNHKRTRPSVRVEPTMSGDVSVLTGWPETAEPRPMGRPASFVNLDECSSRPTAPKNYAAEQKPDASLLPMDLLIKYLVPAYEEGIIKYARDSWREGFHTSVMIAALRRHESLFSDCHEDYDPEAAVFRIQKHHLAGVMFCCLSILNTLETRPELDDRYTPKQHLLDRNDRNE